MPEEITQQDFEERKQLLADRYKPHKDKARADLADLRRDLNDQKWKNATSKVASNYLELSQQKDIDPLTGLLKSEAFKRFALYEMAIVNRDLDTRCVGICLSDIDDFGLVNKIYGIPEGDKLLEELGEKIRNNIRATDVPCRWGGEEFVTMLPYKKPQGGKSSIADSLENKRRALSVRLKDEDVTSTFGYTEYITGEDFESFFSRADCALRIAKLLGKARVVIAERNNGGEMIFKDQKDGIHYKFYKGKDGLDHLEDIKDEGIKYVVKTRETDKKPYLEEIK